MTVYKPGTQLIITELWAAAAAHKLGFEAQSNPNNNKYVILNDIGWIDMFLPDARVWRITVTESGPNAAERFLPQRNDLIETVNDTHFIVTELLPDDPTWVGNKNQSGIQNPFIECRSIIERNGIPFPQFSEVIEPEKENNNGL